MKGRQRGVLEEARDGPMDGGGMCHGLIKKKGSPFDLVFLFGSINSVLALDISSRSLGVALMAHNSIDHLLPCFFLRLPWLISKYRLPHTFIRVEVTPSLR